MSAYRQLARTRAFDRAGREGPLDVTIVLPAFNEEATIAESIEQIANTMDPTGLSYEFLVIDDGSTDETWSETLRAAQRHGNVRGLRHRNNAGKATALANGFFYSRGEVVALCDADLQYDPHDVVRVIEAVHEYDAVSARKIERADPLERRAPSRFFNLFLRRATGVQLHDMNAGLKAFRRDAAQELIQYGYGELHRYFMVILAKRGFSVGEIPVEARPRRAGHSKYGMERYVRGALDFLTVTFLSGYLERPLHLFGGIGLVLGSAGALGLLVSLIAATTGSAAISPWILAVSSIGMISGVQMLLIGLIAEMINNFEREPGATRVVSEVLGIDRRNDGPTPNVERRHPQVEESLRHREVVAQEDKRRVKVSL